MALRRALWRERLQPNDNGVGFTLQSACTVCVCEHVSEATHWTNKQLHTATAVIAEIAACLLAGPRMLQASQSRAKAKRPTPASIMCHMEIAHAPPPHTHNSNTHNTITRETNNITHPCQNHVAHGGPQAGDHMRLRS